MTLQEPLPGGPEEGSPPSHAARIRLHLATLYRPELLEELLRSCESARELVAALSVAPASRVLPGLALSARQRLDDPRWETEAREELERLRQRGIAVLGRDEPGWPANLGGLPLMPFLLFTLGTCLEGDGLAVGIVGTRRPSPYGLRQARRFAGALAEAGWTVVSGLARGIDGECHRVALEAGGRTLAVLGSGLGRVYPREHRGLAAEIVERDRGALITEFPYAASPRRHHFPQRNRILSALSLALLVVEAGERSGSLLTVDWALRQGRPVFVLPGRVDDPEAAGCNRLIQSGAHPVLDPGELLEAVERIAGRRPQRAACGSAGPRAAVLARSSPGEAGDRAGDRFLSRLLPLFREMDAWHPDELAVRLGIDPMTLLAELCRLEGEGWLEPRLGGRYCLRRLP